MRALSLSLALLLVIAGVHALVIDEAGMLTEKFRNDLDLFNAQSRIPLSFITTNASYNIKEQAAENFNTYQLQLLLFYSKAEDIAVVVQPPDEGIPAETIQAILGRYKGAQGSHLTDIAGALMTHVGEWQNLQEGPKPVCALLKDGVCDKTCAGTDLDCLCGDKICQGFETAQTCPRDCKERNLWCGIQRDGYCDANCPSTDIDCPIKPGIVAEHQRTPFLIAAVLGGGLLLLLAMIQFMLRRKR